MLLLPADLAFTWAWAFLYWDIVGPFGTSGDYSEGTEAA
ncbi:hypothetical protein GJR88_01581 [Dietzia sp. DQ12-45-1b]|nr:hypothetical protein GJR88_01581 [Dietzia sp. DQ12-45-1b]